MEQPNPWYARIAHLLQQLPLLGLLRQLFASLLLVVVRLLPHPLA